MPDYSVCEVILLFFSELRNYGKTFLTNLAVFLKFAVKS